MADYVCARRRTELSSENWTKFSVRRDTTPREDVIARYLSEFVHHEYTPGFLLRYRSQRNGRDMITESADGTLADPKFWHWIKRSEEPVRVMQSIVFQVLQAMRAVNLQSFFHHGNLVSKNVLFKTVPVRDGQYWTYTVTHSDGVKADYLIPNYGFVLMISPPKDFDVPRAGPRIREQNVGLSKDGSDLLHSLFEHAGDTPHANWLADILFEWSRSILHRVHGEAFSEDPLGDFLRRNFSGFRTSEPQDGELCAYSDEGRVVTGIELPFPYYGDLDPQRGPLDMLSKMYDEPQQMEFDSSSDESD